MLRSTKRFTLSSETIKNTHGFKVSTKGVDLSHFYNNPLMLWMHQRAGGSKNDVLPLGYWDDIQVKEGKITAVPVFDDKDSFALAIYNKVENGTIRMASAGLVPLTWTKEDNIDVLAGSIMKEASIVDIGSNSEALAVALYDEQDKVINLSDLSFIGYQAPLANQIAGLAYTHKSFDELWLSGELETIKAENPTLYNLKFKEQFGRNPGEQATAKEARKTEREAQQAKEQSQQLARLSAMTYDELWQSNGLEFLKLNHPVIYLQKFKDKFGKLPANI